MGREERGAWLFCNYCGEPLHTWLQAANHVRVDHGKEIYAGVGEFDPGRRTRGFMIFVVVFTLVLVSLAFLGVYQWYYGVDLSGEQGLALVISMIAGIGGSFLYGELYGRKGLKPDREILMDIQVVCEICGERMPFRDARAHAEDRHPGETLEEKRVYGPAAALAVLAIFIGFAGMVVSLLLYDFDSSLDSTGVMLFAASMTAAVGGAVFMYAFEKLYHEPRMEEAAEEWDETHGEAE